MDRERLVAAAPLWLPDRGDPRWSDGRLPGDGRDTADIRWLLSDPESRGGLRTLLEAACRRAARLGCRRITAGDGCGVCPARYGVPASWAHLVAGLSEHGFEVKSRAAMMHARLPDMDHGAPPRIEGLALGWREDPEVPEWAKRGVTDALLQVCLPDPAATRFHEAMGFSVIETGITYRKDSL